MIIIILKVANPEAVLPKILIKRITAAVAAATAFYNLLLLLILWFFYPS